MTDQEFERAVSEHYTQVYYFAFSLTKNEAEACDLTQEAFCRLAAKGRQMQDVSKLKSWLMTTCYREFLREYRHRVRFPHVEVSLVEEALPSVGPEFVNRLDVSALMSALHRIEEVFRVPLMLFYLQNHSYKEIAALLEVPIGTVMSRLARGKAQLRGLLAGPFQPETSEAALAFGMPAISERHHE